MSFILGFRYMPNSVVPYSNTIQEMSGTSQNTIDFNLLYMGNTAITPEIRLYSHKNMRGFYISLYGRYANFDMTIPVKFASLEMGQPITQHAAFSGTISSFSGGFLLGTQQNLGKHIVIDIWILGGHVGRSRGSLQSNFNPALVTSVPPNGTNIAQNLQDALNSIDASPFTFIGKVNVDSGGKTASSATLDCNGPWFGIRGLGINLGVRF